MSYSYASQKENVFREENQKMFLQIRDTARLMISKSGAVTAEKLMAGCAGDYWHMLACYEIINGYSSAGQHRIFIGHP